MRALSRIRAALADREHLEEGARLLRQRLRAYGSDARELEWDYAETERLAKKGT